MRLIACLLLLLAALVPARANTISGTITDSSTGLPIQNAAVVLTNVASPTPQFQFTPAAGTFSFEFTAYSVYDLRVFVQGYYGDQATVIPIPVFLPNPVVNLALDPRPTGNGSISGAITDAASGAKIGGAIVEAYDSTHPDSIFTATVSLNLPTASNYTVTGLPTGTYRLRVTANGYLAQERTGIAVTDGAATTAVNFALSAGEASVAGTVLCDETGLPIGSAVIAILDSNLRPVGAATAAADGTFLLSGLGPGSYTATASHQGYDTGGAFVLNLGATEDRTGIVIRLGDNAAPRPPATVAAEYASPGTARITLLASVDESAALGHGDVQEYRVYASPNGAPAARIATVDATAAASYETAAPIANPAAEQSITVRAWDGIAESEDSTPAVLEAAGVDSWLLM